MSFLNIPNRRFCDPPVMLTLVAVLFSACVLDRTGQSRTQSLFTDISETRSRLDALQKQVDDQRNFTRERLTEVEQKDQLQRLSLADSDAMLEAMVSELQKLRGVYDQIAVQVSTSSQRADRVLEDVDFRLKDFEARLAKIEQSVSSGSAVPDATPPTSSIPDTSETLSDVETLDRAKKYYNSGNFRTSTAFLKGYRERFPQSALREESQFLLGESLFREGNARAALQEYQKLVDDFPKSPRLPAVMFRQGEALIALGEKEDAEVFFAEIVRAWPKSPEAAAASKQLEQLRK